MANSIEVAKIILEKMQQRGKRVDPMQLQKLIYFAQGWTLGLIGESLLDEEIQAWPYGPVVPTVYWKYKKYGAGWIQDDEPNKTIQLPSNLDKVLDQVVSYYSQFTGPVLSGMTHEPNSPWDQVRGVSVPRDVPIPNPVIQTYFSKLNSEKRPY